MDLIDRSVEIGWKGGAGGFFSSVCCWAGGFLLLLGAGVHWLARVRVVCE